MCVTVVLGLGGVVTGVVDVVNVVGVVVAGLCDVVFILLLDTFCDIVAMFGYDNVNFPYVHAINKYPSYNPK
jgi:hypothetical protein